MSTVIEHVRHKVAGRLEVDPRLMLTACGKRFKPAHPVERASIAHHEPASMRCGVCFA